tara:strand:- start:524 stop:2263 length:1740 start_codon:yes stop_codon:yes gene_type:complete
MAETIISPGVFTRENDLSFVAPAPAEAGTAFIGPTVKGPVEIPTVVTSYGQYQRIFGSTFESGSTKQEFLTSISVRSFFNQGGSTALITRVVNGSFAPASNTHLSASAKASVEPFTIDTLGEGLIFNNSTGASDSGKHNSDSSLATGSEDNLRWEISNVNNAKGTFTLSVRRGDDNLKEKVVLETFSNLSLDPNSNNYVESVVGNQIEAISSDKSYVTVTGEYPNNSNYIRIASVNLQTLNYLANDGATVNVDPAGVSFSGSLPIASSGSFHSATGAITKAGAVHYNGFSSTDTQGLVGSDYDDVITLLGNVDDYQFNVVVAPGLIADEHSTQVNNIISLAEQRGDCIYILDTADYAEAPAAVITKADTLNSSYAATYYPYLQVGTETGKNQFVPPSVVIPGVYAANDNSSAPWFAPAGLNRGGIPGVIQAERKVSKAQRDLLYDGNVNPIATFPGSGIAVFGQKTLQKRPTALDRINVRRLLIELKKFFGDQARNLVFEQNTINTRNRFLAAVNPYLESVVQRQGLFAYRVVMDDTNNTADVIDRNQLVGQVFIQPAKTAEFIVLDFTIEPTGASFTV